MINLTDKNYELDEAARIIGISLEDCVGFLEIKKYIKKEPYGYSATACGVDLGNVINDDKHNALITTNGVCKIASAFANLDEGYKLLEKNGYPVEMAY